MSLPDYSEYLKRPGRFDITERDWIDNPGKHDVHAKIVNDFIKKNKVESVIEIGCGSGETARRLTGFKDYVGIDSNADCIEYAEKKTGQALCAFLRGDIREINLPSIKNDLVICFSVLKHFGLHEWYDIFKKISSFGDNFIFDMQIAETTKDDGVDFHHVWLTLEDLKKYIADAGFKILRIEQNPHVPLEPIFICKKK